jgi:biopolymer transport protein ExbD
VKVPALLLSILLCAATQAGLVFEFDGTTWDPKPRRKALRKATDTTLCLIADSGTRFDQLLPVLSLINPDSPPSLKLQLRDQPQSVLIHLSLPREEVPDSFVTVLTGPAGTWLMEISPTAGIIHSTSKLGPDLAGIQAFLNHAADLYRPKDDESTTIPTTAFMVRSNCSIGQLVTLTQLLKQSGLGPVALAVNDELPDLDIEVTMDKRIAIPVPDQPEHKPEPKHRIIIYLDPKGLASAEDKAPLDTDEDIATYIRSRKTEIEEAGGTPNIQVRGDKDSLFNASRRIIRIAAKEDVHQVIFASYSAEAALLEELQHRERDLEMALPSTAPVDPDVADLPPLFILIDAEGTISANTGPAKELLDINPKDRSLPLLTTRLQAFANAAKIAKQEPLVQLYADPKVPQQRVVDVLNAIAQVKIGKVTFVDLIEKE